uniref:BTB domain-containing protein n=1 Tax=Ditylenchus dipsaci TaxID=166011 RepID=A0A915E9B3_9BILA
MIRGLSSFIPWSKLIDKAEGLIDESGNFMMQAEFFLGARTNTQVPLNLDYSTSNFVEPDCTLVVEDQKIPVCKALLVIHSTYFKTMFSRDFREKIRIEIPRGLIREKTLMGKMWSACRLSRFLLMKNCDRAVFGVS